MKCSRCENDDFIIKDGKLVCEYCDRQKYIKKGTSLDELEKLIIELKSGEYSEYSFWTNLGEIMYKLLQKHKKDIS